MVLLDIKSAKVTERGQIAIPKSIRKMSGFSIGVKIAILAYEDHIEIRSLDQIKEKWAKESQDLSSKLISSESSSKQNVNQSDNFKDSLQINSERLTPRIPSREDIQFPSQRPPMPPKPPKRRRKKRTGWRFI